MHSNLSKNVRLRVDAMARIHGGLPYESYGTRVLWSLPDPQEWKLVGGGQSDLSLFDDVMTIRNRTDDRWPDQGVAVDRYSDHYCMLVDATPVGCLSITRALHGEIFFQEYFPQAFFDHFQDRVVSAYRFRLLPQYRRTSQQASGIGVATIMAKEIWREQIAKGVGIDLINVERSYVRYYQRLGYVLCEGYDFICPIFHEPISIMYLPTDPTRDSIIKDLVQGRTDNVLMKNIHRVLRRRVFAVKSVH